MKRLTFVFSTLALLSAAFGAGAQAPSAPRPGERVAVYDWLAAHLPRYRTLATKKWPGPLPVVKKVSPGDAYAGTAALAEILRDLGDLPEGAAVSADGTYGGALAEAVKAFQARHGLKDDGVIGAGTFTALNHPYAERLTEIEESLKWLDTIHVPESESLVVVNIPSFQLYAWTAADRGKNPSLRMPVVVGKAAKSRTPILGGEISYLVFRPYWYVPRSIVVKEMLPAYAKNPAYFESHQLELTATNDDTKPGVATTPENVELLRAGKLGVRQKPGPRNSLGKVKFIFPNSESVYLHDTPAKSLFDRERRDFSHGCVRVSDPPALAAFLLRSMPGWDAAKIKDAMEAERPQTVNVKPRVPVWLVYTTAIASVDGRIGFYENVYRRAGPAGGPVKP
jgi:murein L,D-transpeptidase YcbB/YkuD